MSPTPPARRLRLGLPRRMFSQVLLMQVAIAAGVAVLATGLFLAPLGNQLDDQAMRRALDDAGLPPAAVGYANAHGTGTLQNDRAEALALRAVFGEGGVLVSSTKSLIGHTMAAAGSVEAMATVLALQHGLLPPTANLEQTDPDVAFDCLPGIARAANVDAALSNSFGFGGQNVSLIFARADS